MSNNKERSLVVWIVALVVVVLVAAFIWIKFGSSAQVSADVADNEAAPTASSSNGVLTLDDGGVSIVEPNQLLTYRVKVDVRKLMLIVAPNSNIDTEDGFRRWQSSHPYDRYIMNGWIGNGKGVISGVGLLASPNFSIELPKLSWPIDEITLRASGSVTNSDVVRNTITTSFRFIYRGCISSNTCPIARKVRVAEVIDKDVITYANNQVDIAVTEYTVDPAIIIPDPGLTQSFTIKYVNNGNNIAGGAKLKVLLPDGAYSAVEGKTLAKETIDGRKYDVFYQNLGDLSPSRSVFPNLQPSFTFKATPIDSVHARVISRVLLTTTSQDRDTANNELTMESRIDGQWGTLQSAGR